MKLLHTCDGCGAPGGIAYDCYHYCPTCLPKHLIFSAACDHLEELLTDVMVEFMIAYADILPLKKLADMPVLIMDRVLEDLNSREGVQPFPRAA